MIHLPDQIYAHEGNKRIAYVRSDLVPPEHASNEPGNLGKGLPNVPDNVPEKENIANRWSLSINYGPDGEDGWANLTSPEGDHVANIRTHHAKTIVAGLNRAGDVAPPVSSWVGWRSIDTAPEDQHVILCTSGGHVGEAIMLVDEDTGQQKWAWALGPLHPNHIPYGWQALPEALNAPAASDLRPGGFDGPTGAE